MGSGIPGQVILSAEENSLSKREEVSLQVAVLHGLCISSYLHVPAPFEFLP